VGLVARRNETPAPPPFTTKKGMTMTDEETTVHKTMPVYGYTDQPDHNVIAVNNNKQIEEKILRLLDSMATHNGVDKRWLAVGRTHIEQGFMAINRAIFQPQRAKLEHEADADAYAQQHHAKAHGGT